MQIKLEQREAPSETSQGVSTGGNSDLRKDSAKLLVVDDEKAVCEILSLYLGSKGLQVMTAQNPEEALQVASETHFDLVILDWDLGGVEALELLNFFKSTSPERPVIIFTGKEIEDAFLKRALAARADAILHKLGSLASLSKEVARLLRKEGRQEPIKQESIQTA